MGSAKGPGGGGAYPLRRLLAEADEQQAHAAVYVYLGRDEPRRGSVAARGPKRTVGNPIERLGAGRGAQRQPGPATDKKDESQHSGGGGSRTHPYGVQRPGSRYQVPMSSLPRLDLECLPASGETSRNVLG